MKKQLYNRYPIIAIAAATARYHRNTGINLEIRNMDNMMHKPPAYFLHVYLITNPPSFNLLKHTKICPVDEAAASLLTGNTLPGRDKHRIMAKKDKTLHYIILM